MRIIATFFKKLIYVLMGLVVFYLGSYFLPNAININFPNINFPNFTGPNENFYWVLVNFVTLSAGMVTGWLNKGKWGVLLGGILIIPIFFFQSFMLTFSGFSVGGGRMSMGEIQPYFFASLICLPLGGFLGGWLSQRLTKNE